MAEVHDLEVSEVSEIEAVEEQDEQIEQAAAVAAKPEVADEIPDEFKGMSPAEIARIALHARREMGRQGNELGEIRKLADELIKSQLKKPESDQVKEVDFFENPQEAIRRAIEANPRVVAAEEGAAIVQKALSKATFEKMHPDYQDIIKDQSFGEWIGKSRIRAELWEKAQAFNVDAADELFSTFKALKAVRQEKQSEVSDAEKTARTSTLKAAAVDTGGSGESSKKVFRRADLIRLKMRDPDKYESMADEITLAYQQGRVK